ncbi:hypothetical protein KBC99_00005 [Candidatus Saccharibacteria bacterium]|nr:hypothetical protein [Candidatus Saccharibacteria bacterium]
MKKTPLPHTDPDFVDFWRESGQSTGRILKGTIQILVAGIGLAVGITLIVFGFVRCTADNANPKPNSSQSTSHDSLSAGLAEYSVSPGSSITAKVMMPSRCNYVVNVENHLDHDIIAVITDDQGSVETPVPARTGIAQAYNVSSSAVMVVGPDGEILASGSGQLSAACNSSGEHPAAQTS